MRTGYCKKARHVTRSSAKKARRETKENLKDISSATNMVNSNHNKRSTISEIIVITMNETIPAETNSKKAMIPSKRKTTVIDLDRFTRS